MLFSTMGPSKLNFQSFRKTAVDDALNRLSGNYKEIFQLIPFPVWNFIMAVYKGRSPSSRMDLVLCT